MSQLAFDTSKVQKSDELKEMRNEWKKTSCDQDEDEKSKPL